MKKKHGYKYDFIDKKARNTFKVGRVITPMIKCVCRYNYFEKQDEIINDYMVKVIRSRCELIKTWEHVIQCDMNKRGRPILAKDLIETLLKNRPKNVKEDVVISFMEDIMKYVLDDNIGEY